jgi:hypothetical protein
MGYQAGFNNSTGSGNVFLGYMAGYYETGSDRLYIANSDADPPLIYGQFDTGKVGIGTTSPSSTLEVQTSSSSPLELERIGKRRYQFQITNKGHLQINDQTVSKDRITIKNNGKVGIGTANPVTKLAIKGLAGTSSFSNLRYNSNNGAIYYFSSSSKYKEDIRALSDDFHTILSAKPKSFIDKVSGERNIGFIAEEFDELGLNNLVIYRDGEPDALKYDLVSLYLLEVVKEQVQTTKQLKAENKTLKNQLKTESEVLKNQFKIENQALKNQLKAENQALKQRLEALERTMQQFCKGNDLGL